MPASGAIAVLAVLGVFADYVHPFEPKALLWVPSVVGPIVTFLAFLRTARTTALPEPTRRFWRHLTVALGFVGIGVVVQVFEVLTADDPAGPHTGPVMLAFVHRRQSASSCTRCSGSRWAASRRGELLRVLLDAGTVMLAAAVFIWHFATREALRRQRQSPPATRRCPSP